MVLVQLESVPGKGTCVGRVSGGGGGAHGEMSLNPAPSHVMPERTNSKAAEKGSNSWGRSLNFSGAQRCDSVGDGHAWHTWGLVSRQTKTHREEPWSWLSPAWAGYQSPVLKWDLWAWKEGS